MRVQVRKLRDTLEILEPLVPKSPTMKVLGNILLKDGQALAVSLETKVMVDLPEASEAVVLRPGVIDFLRFIPGDTIVEITPKVNGQTVVACGKSTSSFPFVNPDDFPGLPEIPDLNLHMDGDRLIEAIIMARPYMPRRDESRPVLNGVTVSIGPEKSYVAAGDGFRMLFKEIPLKSEACVWVIPDEVIPKLIDLWKKTAQPDPPEVDALLTQMMIAKRLMRVGTAVQDEVTTLFARFGKVTLATRLVSGTPPEWLTLVPSGHVSTLKVNSQEFYRAVQQVADVAGEGSGIVRLAWEGSELSVIAKADDQTAEVVVPIALEGEEGNIAFNIRYLSDYLKPRQGTVEIKLSDPSRPGLFLDGRCTVVVMPILLAKETPTEEPSEPPANQASEQPPAEELQEPASEAAPDREQKKTRAPRKKKVAAAGAKKDD